VHVSTVSRVVNGSEVPIKAETRRRVMRAARKLNYRPNAMARALKLAETGALGMLMPSLRNPVLADMIHGAYERALERGFVVLLAEDSGDVQTERAYTMLVEEGRIDGLMIASASAHSKVGEMVSGRAIPFVYLNRRVPGSGRNVAMRDEEAGRIAAERFLQLGHRRLAVLAGSMELDTAQRRRVGFIEAAGAAHIEPDVVFAAWDSAEGRERMHELLELAPRPTAVFVSNINQALGAVAAIREVGVRVPEDMSVIVCDDDPLVEFLDPRLTTVRMPLAELGAAGVEALIAQIEGDEPEDVLLASAPELIERASTGPPAA
jgi:LacI family transcriptional regulator